MDGQNPAPPRSAIDDQSIRASLSFLASTSFMLSSFICAGSSKVKAMNQDLQSAASSVSATKLIDHIKILASDHFQGRAPGSEGEARTCEYLQEQCKLLGLSPDPASQSYFQKVPVYGLKAEPTLSFSNARQSIQPVFPDDYVALSRDMSDKVKVENSDVVFVGYGVIAPEYGWDDYKGLDVRGKTVIMLIGDPSRPEPADPSKLDETFFRGKAMTYYGRWTYKYEIASKLGAAAVFIVHEREPAGYGYDVVTSSWGQENFDLGSYDKRVKVEGWLALDTAEKLFALGGVSFKEAKERALRSDFRPITFDGNLKSTATVKSTRRKFESCNVVGILKGSDPELSRQCVLYSAHWDHFGTRQNDDGTVGIFSGALDNGSGMATILEIARAFTRLPCPPKRSVVFLFTTLEERGLLGSLHYVQAPIMPLEKTLAIINVDIMNLWGRTREIVSIAKGHSSLDDILERHASGQGRSVVADPDSDKGYFYRSDHLEFIRKGVPALFFLHPGASYIGKPPDYGMRKRQEYVSNDYHKITDKVKPDWDASGAVEDARLLFQTGFEIADGDSFPHWRTTSEFYRERP